MIRRKVMNKITTISSITACLYIRRSNNSNTKLLQYIKYNNIVHIHSYYTTSRDLECDVYNII